MIFNTNRTMSLGEATLDVDVNESYFGAGAFNFMQENAEMELSLFEAAVKSDIDEYMIGESADELSALNEGFVKTAADKIKEMMEKFIEWIKAVTRSAIAKVTQIVVRDNDKFCTAAEKRIATMKNYDKFKYSGKAIKNPSSLNFKEFFGELTFLRKLWEKVSTADSASDIEDIKQEIEKDKQEYEAPNDKNYFEDVENKDLSIVQEHIKFLKSGSKSELKDINKTCKEFESFARKIAKDAKNNEKKYDKDNETEKNRLAVASTVAAYVKSQGQKVITNELTLIKKLIKVARAVVTKAMGATPKNEGVEYTEELVNAMIESFNYEIDEAMEEMSKCEECDSDDISDDDDEE